MFVSIFTLDLLLSLSSLILSSSKAIVEEMVTNDDNERRVMSYNPELSYKVAILSVVAYDQSHPQHCLDQYLPSAKFQFWTFVTKTCDFLDNKCSVYAAVSQALQVLVFRCWSVVFRGTKDMRQLIDDSLVIATTPSQDFLNGKVQAYFKAAFEDLWRCMKPKVKALVSKNPSY